MNTVYDFVTMALFAGLIVLFLQRSTGAQDDPHPMWEYLVAAVGCAVTNFVGNAGHDVIAILFLLMTIGFTVVILQPVPLPPRR